MPGSPPFSSLFVFGLCVRVKPVKTATQTLHYSSSCPTCYGAASRAITHKRVKKEGSLSLFLSLHPRPPLSLARLPARPLTLCSPTTPLFLSFVQRTEFLSCRHVKGHMLRDVISSSANTRRFSTQHATYVRTTILSRARRTDFPNASHACVRSERRVFIDVAVSRDTILTRRSKPGGRAKFSYEDLARPILLSSAEINSADDSVHRSNARARHSFLGLMFHAVFHALVDGYSGCFEMKIALHRRPTSRG